MAKKSRQKFKYLENEKSFQGEIQKHFLFLKGFQLPKTVSDLRVRLYFAISKICVVIRLAESVARVGGI